MRVKLRRVKAACVTAVACGLVFAVTNSASAADISLGAYGGGGFGYWKQDPGPDPIGYGDAPGDSIAACDQSSDGYGIEVRLDVGRDGDIDRTTSTLGHYAPYCTGWASGNLPEGTPIRMWVAKVDHDGRYHPVYQDGTA
jgi:hypothetical protein